MAHSNEMDLHIVFIAHRATGFPFCYYSEQEAGFQVELGNRNSDSRIFATLAVHG